MNDSPIRLPVSAFRSSPPAVMKIRRGGTGKVSNSGSIAKIARTPVRAVRDTKTGKHLPWPVRAPVVWDPRDPFIIEYRKAHPPVEAAWRSAQGSEPIMVGLDIETRD